MGNSQEVIAIRVIEYVPEGRVTKGRKATTLTYGTAVTELEMMDTVAPEELYTTPTTMAVITTPAVFT